MTLISKKDIILNWIIRFCIKKTQVMDPFTIYDFMFKLNPEKLTDYYNQVIHYEKK